MDPTKRQPIAAAQHAAAAAPAASPGHGRRVSIEIPLRVTIELGAVAAEAASLGVPPGAESAALERMVEPAHDPDYGNRRGYREGFLEGRTVPMPRPVNPDLLAPLKSGGSRLDYQHFSVLMHRQRRIAWITASNINREDRLRKPESGRDYTRKGLGGLGPSDSERWFEDTRIDRRYQLPDAFFTQDGGAFDKGHIVRREDVAWGTSYEEVVRANGDTFHVTNCSPQVAQFNQSARGEDNWGDLENLVFAGAAQERLCVFAGPVLAPDDETFVGRGRDGDVLRVRIPSRYWKVIVSATPTGIAAHGFVLEQDLSGIELEFVVAENFRRLQVPLSAIEESAGVDFGDELRTADTFESEEGVDLAEHGGLVRTARIFASDREQPTPNASDDDEAARESNGEDELAEAVAAALSWRVARSLSVLRRQVDGLAPGRSKASDGTIGDAAHASRDSDHNPWVVDAGVGVVTAMDITHDPAHGCDAGALAQRIVASRDQRVKYVISNRRIANSSSIGGAAPWTWRPYGGSNPHEKHVHVSVKAQRAAYDDESPWMI